MSKNIDLNLVDLYGKGSIKSTIHFYIQDVFVFESKYLNVVLRESLEYCS